MVKKLHKALKPQNLFAAALKEYLKDKKRGTQSQIADAVKLNRSLMSDWLNKGKRVPVHFMESIASYLDTTIEDMEDRGREIVFTIYGDQIRNELKKTGRNRNGQSDAPIKGTEEMNAEEYIARLQDIIERQEKEIDLLMQRQERDQSEIDYLRKLDKSRMDTIIQKLEGIVGGRDGIVDGNKYEDRS